MNIVLKSKDHEFIKQRGQPLIIMIVSLVRHPQTKRNSWGLHGRLLCWSLALLDPGDWNVQGWCKPWNVQPECTWTTKKKHEQRYTWHTTTTNLTAIILCSFWEVTSSFQITIIPFPAKIKRETCEALPEERPVSSSSHSSLFLGCGMGCATATNYDGTCLIFRRGSTSVIYMILVIYCLNPLVENSNDMRGWTCLRKTCFFTPCMLGKGVCKQMLNH